MTQRYKFKFKFKFNLLFKGQIKNKYKKKFNTNIILDEYKKDNNLIKLIKLKIGELYMKIMIIIIFQ